MAGLASPSSGNYLPSGNGSNYRVPGGIQGEYGPTPQSPNYITYGGSDYGDMYNRRAQAQQQTGDPYGYDSSSAAIRANQELAAGMNYARDTYDPQAVAAENARKNAWDFAQNVAGFNNAWNNTQRGYLGADYQNNLDSLNWQRGGLANDLTNAQQNLGMQDQIVANLQKMYGINDRELANKIAQSMLGQSVDTAVLNQQTGLNALTGLQKSQSATSAGIAGGGFLMPGMKVGLGQISEETGRNADILANKLRGVTEGGDLTRQGLNIGKEGTDVNLANQILNVQKARLGDQSSLFNAQRAGQGLDIKQRGYENDYNQKVGGIDYTQNKQIVDAIAGGMNSNDEALRGLYQQWAADWARKAGLGG